MRERLYILIFAVLGAGTLLLAGNRWRLIHAWDQSPEQQTRQALHQFLVENNSLTSLDWSTVAPVPNQKLTASDHLLPQTFFYDTNALRDIFRYSETCLNPPNSTTTSLQKTLIWSLYICGASKAPSIDFFKKPPFIHPAGYSFAAAAIQRKLFPLSALATQVHRGELAELIRVVDETARIPAKYAADFKILANTEPEAIDLLGSGKLWVIGKTFVFHKDPQNERDSYQVFHRSIWNNYWTMLPLVPAFHSADVACRHSDLDICWTRNRKWTYQAAPLVAATASVLLIGCLAWIAVLYLRRKKSRDQELSERLLMLQLLTHELRTPVTSMRLDLELLRKEMAALGTSAQESFLRVCIGTQRIMRALHASEGYLATFSRGGDVLDERQQIPSINDLITSQIDHIFDDRASLSRLKIQLPESDINMTLQPEILAVCIRNLLQNALRHGKGNISVAASVHERRLKISIADEGSIEPKYLLPSAFKTPFAKSNTSPGMGLGLFLVKTFIHRLGGNFSVTGNPTQFILDLPLSNGEKR